MTNLLDWAERNLKTVEQDGASVAVVKLITAHDGEVWETWHAPFPEAADWATGAEGFLRSLENEWPNRAVSVVFVASSAGGEVLSRLPARVQGKNKAQGAPWNTDQAAFSMAMDNAALTMEKLQRLCNSQLDASRKIAESNAVTIFQQSEYIKLLRQNAVMGESESPDALGRLIGEHAEDFIELGKLALKAYSSKVPSTTKPTGAVAALKKVAKE